MATSGTARARWTMVVPVSALVALCLLPSVVLAQAFLTPGEVEVEVEGDATRIVTFQLRNAVNVSLVGFVRVDGGIAATGAAQPAEFRLAPGGTRIVDIVVDGTTLEAGRTTGTLHILLVNQETGATQRLRSNITVVSVAPLLVFQVYENPLPSPLDGPFGVFVLEMALWVVLALVLVKVNDSVMGRAMGRRVPAWLKSRVMNKVDKPLFILVVVAGAKTAWRGFPDEGMYAFVAGVLSAATVFLVAYLAYRLVDATLLYYKENVAGRTETKIDDVIVPVLRKVAFVVIVALGFVFTIESFGVDLSFLVAGGLVVGLVVSAAAAPTLSNLFAGFFLMMDRPFVEGDDIRLDSGEVCRVERVGMRSTRLYYYRNHEVIVMPNNDLAAKPVVNLLVPDHKYRMHVPIGVAYGSDVALVTRLLTEVGEGHPEILHDVDSSIVVMFDDFGDSALMFRLMFFVGHARDRFRIASEVRYKIESAFREHDVEIPFPQRTVWFPQMQDRDEA